MPGVLTAASSIGCATQGTVQATGSSKLVVQGSGVLVLSGVASWTVVGCKRNTPCATVSPPTGGISTRLTVGGSPVLLATLAALGSSGDAVTATVVQSKLTSS